MNIKLILKSVLMIFCILVITFILMKVVPAVNNYSINYIKMVKIKGGTFQMGSNNNEADNDEKPFHSVKLNDFKMSVYTVTVIQFKRFMDDAGYKTDADKRTDGYGSYIYMDSTWKDQDGVNWKCRVDGSLRPKDEYNHPVIHVSWNDAIAYADWLSNKTGEKYSLPTEAEWEYAALAGQGFKYSGSNNINDVGWYAKNSNNKIHSSGMKLPNDYGLYDMSGNVWEWCADWYAEDYYKTSPLCNPVGPETGEYRVRRGGSWLLGEQFSRIANRGSHEQSYRSYRVGFRLVSVP